MASLPPRLLPSFTRVTPRHQNQTFPQRARGDEVIKKDEEARLKREKLKAGPQNEDLTPQELRQKALALEEEARQASEYADSLEGIKRYENATADFEHDYRAYVQDHGSESALQNKADALSYQDLGRDSVSDDKAHSDKQEYSRRRREFEQALRSPSRIEIKKISSEDKLSGTKIMTRVTARSQSIPVLNRLMIISRLTPG